MKPPARPHFFTRLSTHLTKIPQFNWRRSKTSGPVPDPRWQRHQREWEPVLTPEQEASYPDDSWTNSTPHISDMDTVAEMPAINVKTIMSHMCGDTPDQFAAIIGQLITPGIQNKQLIPRVPTGALPGAKHITGSLRHINVTDPYLPSARVTPNYEFAIVPRRTAQLPLNEHKLSVEELVNAAIVAFHEQHHRLPHKITIAAIRYLRYKISIDTYDPDLFFYKDIAIPITNAPVGDFGIDEVRLD